jgi:hypothetical protein
VRPLLPTGSSWIDAAKTVPVEQVAPTLGLSVRGRSFGPCPACNADRRGGSDRRHPCGYGKGWGCFPCGAKGDALDLAAWRVGGARLRDLTPERKAEVRAWYAGQGWCDPAPGATGAPVAVPRRAPVVKPERPPEYPPEAEVAALWAACSPLDTASIRDPAVPWLEGCEKPGRGLDCRALGALDLARLLPLDPEAYPWPSWIPWLGMDRSEWLRVYRLAVPMYDHRGGLRALRFRAVTHVREPSPEGGMRWRDLEVKAGKKALAASGMTTSGLVLADPVGVALLRGELEGLPWDGWVSVCEGEPDLWTCSTAMRRGKPDDAPTWATLGVVSGSWTDDLAARVPSGARVVVHTHADPRGNEYAERIRRSLAGRCEVVRVNATGPREED